MGQVLAFRPRAAKAVERTGSLVTYEFDTRSHRDAFVRMMPGSWSGYSVTPDGYRWFAYIQE